MDVKTLSVLSVPYVCTGPTNISNTAGSRRTPAAIRTIYESWNKAGVRFLKEDGSSAGLNFGREISKSMLLNSDLMHELMRKSLLGGGRVCFLGGDNALSYHTAKAFRERFFNRRCGLVMFDAHPDLCRKGKPGMPYHSDWLRYLIDESLFRPADILGIGWRDVEAEERDFAEQIHLTNVWPMSALRFENPRLYEPHKQSFERSVRLFCEKFDAVYVSIDFDVLDPAYAPGVNTVSPGGMNSGYFIEVIKGLSAIPAVKAFDITEINPKRDVNNKMTQILAIKTMIEMA